MLDSRVAFVQRVHAHPPSLARRVLRPGSPSYRFKLVSLLALSAFVGPADGSESLRQGFWVTNGPVHAVVESGNTVFVGGEFTRVGPMPGNAVALDVESGEPLMFPDVDGTVLAIAADGAGGWFLGGAFAHVGGVPRSHVAHIGPDHRVTAWNPGADGNVYSFVIAGPLVYAGGTFTSIGGLAREGLAALDAQTGAVTAWDPKAPGVVWSLALHDSIIFAAGQFTTIGDLPRRHLAAISARTGSALDWNRNFEGDVHVLRVADSKLYVGGGFTAIGGQPRSCVARLDPHTGLADDWNPNVDGPVVGLGLSGSAVYLGGGFTTVGGEPRARLAAVDATSGAPRSWAPTYSRSIKVFAVAGDRVVVGTASSFDFTPGLSGLVSFDAVTGDSLWDAHVTGLSLSLAIDGGIAYIGGNLLLVGGVPRSHLAAFDVTTGRATDWNPAANGTIRALRVVGSTVYAGGGFTRIGAASRRRVAAIDAVTGVPLDWSPEVDGTVRALEMVGDRLFVGGDFTQVSGAPRERLAAFDLPGGGLASWRADADGIVRALIGDGATLYVGGSFSAVGAEPRALLAAVDASTGTVSPWNPTVGGSTNPDVYALALRSGEVLAGGDFGSVAGMARRNLAAIDRATGVPSTWNPSPQHTLYALAEYGDEILAGGASMIAKFDPSTGSSGGWAIDGPVYAVAHGAANFYVGGAFTRFAGARHAGVAALGHGDDTTPTLVLRFAPTPTEAGIVLRWSFAFESRVVSSWIERRESPTGVWSRLTAAASRESDGWVVTDHEVVPGRRYSYRLAIESPSGEVVRLAAIEVVASNAADDLSIEVRGLQPSDGLVELQYTLGRATAVQLDVFDLQGRTVASLERGVRAAGRHEAWWRPRAAGVYLVRLAGNNRIVTKKLVVRP